MAEDVEPLLTIKQVAELYQVSPRTVETWISQEVGPRSIKTPTGRRRFTLAAVREDMARRVAA